MGKSEFAITDAQFSGLVSEMNTRFEEARATELNYELKSAGKSFCYYWGLLRPILMLIKLFLKDDTLIDNMIRSGDELKKQLCEKERDDWE